MKYCSIPVPLDFIYDETSPSGLARITKNGVKHIGFFSGRYYRVKIKSKNYTASRVIWTILNGPIPDGMEVEHADGNRHNNTIENLRLANRSENCCNRSGWNVGGYPTGVRLDNPRTGLYKGQVKKDHKTYRFSSKSLEEVIEWVTKTRSELHGEFAKSI